jgi:murein DD-endopeptidase MepM/ murein hydrolase activator NlpD
MRGTIAWFITGQPYLRMIWLTGYGTSIDEIVNFIGNDFKDEIPGELTPGVKIIVPGGENPILWQEPDPRVVPGKGLKSPGYYSGPLVNMGTGYFSWPVSPIVITHPYWSSHLVIDIATYARQPIFASDSGTIIFSDWDNTGFGNLVIIDHGNGYWTYYGHNTANLVRVGQGVVKGQQISESGSMGNSTGNHIDFRIRSGGGSFLNPADFLP